MLEPLLITARTTREALKEKRYIVIQHMHEMAVWAAQYSLRASCPARATHYVLSGLTLKIGPFDFAQRASPTIVPCAVFCTQPKQPRLSALSCAALRKPTFWTCESRGQVKGASVGITLGDLIPS